MIKPLRFMMPMLCMQTEIKFPVLTCCLEKHMRKECSGYSLLQNVLLLVARLSSFRCCATSWTKWCFVEKNCLA